MFNTAGTFEVTVTATSLNGKSVSRSVQIAITLAEPELSEITLDPAVAELTGGEGATAETTVSFTVDAESKVSVTVKQDGVAIENAYEEESKKVTLSAAGIYVIEVTAERNGYTVTRSATFIVRNSSAAVPEVSFTATNATVEEDADGKCRLRGRRDQKGRKVRNIHKERLELRKRRSERLRVERGRENIYAQSRGNLPDKTDRAYRRGREHAI